MKSNETILDKISRNDGFTTPVGYFEDFAERLTSSLPERIELESPEKILNVPRTPWQRIRPYVYMAAMFAGVWCMLKMFSLMNVPADPLAIESYPELADALSNDQQFKEMVTADINPWDLVDEMMDDELDLSLLPMPGDDMSEDYATEDYYDIEYTGNFTLPDQSENLQ